MAPVLPLNQNIFAQKAQRKLSEGSAGLQSAFERLSSGLRINRASDDAAGLAVASGLQNDARVFNQAVRNINDAVNMIHIAEGAIDALTSILYRQRELATQAANGSLSRSQREALNTEANALVDEYNRIAQSTDYNGQKLIDGSFQASGVQIGYGTDGSINFDLGDELSRTVGDGTFGDTTNLATSGRPGDVQLLDLNGDDILDLLYVESNLNQLTVQLGDGEGGFGSATSFATSAIYSTGIVTGDFDGDGNIDVASSSYYTSDVDVFLGNGDGTFGAKTTYTADGNASDITAGDLNGDGVLDLIVTDGYYNTGKVSILLGDGDGTFTSNGSVDIGSGLPYGATVGDLNGDGNNDIIVADYSLGNLTVLLGNGDATFGAATTYAVGTNPVRPVLADFNNDGYLDVATGHSGSAFFSVLLGNGDGTFEDAVNYSTVDPNFRLDAGDLNGDGIIDLVVAKQIGRAEVRLGNGDGTFQDGTDYSTAGGGTKSLALGDLDGDGGIDIVTANYTLTSLSVIMADTHSTSISPYLNLNTQSDALASLEILDATLDRITGEKGAHGSTQSRLSAAANILSAARDNSQAAYSRIVSVDAAEETARMVQLQVLQDAATAVLAQANLLPEMVLDLLN